MHQTLCYRPLELTDTEIELFEQLTRRRFLIGAGALVLAGCGAPGVSAPTATVAAMRRVTHVLGETDVPRNPQRVIALEPFMLDSLLALGYKPMAVLTSDFFRCNGFPCYLGDAVDGIQKVEGAIGEPNLEFLATLAPDLILAVPEMEAIYAQLSAIAPTVAINRGVQLKWQEVSRQIADSLDLIDAAERVISAYDERVAKIAEQAPTGFTVSLVNSWDTNNRLYLSDSFAGGVIEAAGFVVVPTREAANTEEFFITLSLERLDLVEADAVFFIEDVPGESMIRENQVLWEQVPAVQAGRVYEIDNEAYLASRGPIAANRILDDLERYILQTSRA